MSERAPLSARDMLFVDVETSSLDPKVGEIVEVAALLAAPDLSSCLGRVHRLVRMRRPEAAEKRALEVCRYDADLWRRHGVDVRVALVEFESLARKSADEPVFVAMNPIFDRSFLVAACDRVGYPMPEFRYHLDVGSMAWPLMRRGLVDRIGLDELCARYGVEQDGRHSALGDVRRLVRVYSALIGARSPI